VKDPAQDKGSITASVLVDGVKGTLIEVKMNPKSSWIQREGGTLTEKSAIDLAFREAGKTIPLSRLIAGRPEQLHTHYLIRLCALGKPRAERYAARITLDSTTGRIERVDFGYDQFTPSPPGVIPREMAVANARAAATAKQLLPPVEDLPPEVDLIVEDCYIINFRGDAPMHSLDMGDYAKVYIDAKTGKVLSILGY